MDTRLEKASTALVVIDLQKGIVSIPTQPHEVHVVVGNAVRLVEAFRKHQMPVFLVTVSASKDGRDRLNPVVDGNTGLGNDQRPSDWSEIVPELAPEDGDHLIIKKQWGAFYGTDLDLQLRRREIRTIVLCGISTNIGVESTARFAYEYGYQQIFVEDAMSSRSAVEHEHTISRIFTRIGRVR
ncbi:MAG: hydrolase, partial [Chlorobiaceae bacterium]|nr:hydrolase [Chlorobiaceae bacterium]